MANNFSPAIGLGSVDHQVTEMDEPTAFLRFVQRGEKRILQQQWRVERWASNGNRSMSRDWRDVPLVEVEPEVQS